MKKNILAIVILAATIVNITLSAIILFTIVPKAQRTDALIQKIVSIINLELEDPDASQYAEVPFADRLAYSLTEKVTVNLKKDPLATDTNTKSRMAQIDVTLVLNSKSGDYEKIQPKLVEQEAIIRGIVMDKVSQYTADEVLDKKETIEEEIYKYLWTYFESEDFLVDVVLNILVS